MIANKCKSICLEPLFPATSLTCSFSFTSGLAFVRMTIDEAAVEAAAVEPPEAADVAVALADAAASRSRRSRCRCCCCNCCCCCWCNCCCCCCCWCNCCFSASATWARCSCSSWNTPFERAAYYRRVMCVCARDWCADIVVVVVLDWDMGCLPTIFVYILMNLGFCV